MTDSDKLTMVLLDTQLIKYPIGLEGYAFFTVTYKFLGSVSITLKFQLTSSNDST